MRPAVLLLSMLVLTAAVSSALAQDGPIVTVSGALSKDTFEGELPAAEDEVHVELFLGVDSNFDVEVDDRGDDPAEGLFLRLFGPSDEIEITGTNKDKSKPNKNLVKWVNIKAPESGLYRLELGASASPTHSGT